MEKHESFTASGSLDKVAADGRLDIPAGAKLSPALRRLVEEVRTEATTGSSSTTRYDRVHNRHNRG